MAHIAEQSTLSRILEDSLMTLEALHTLDVSPDLELAPDADSLLGMWSTWLCVL